MQKSTNARMTDVRDQCATRLMEAEKKIALYVMCLDLKTQG
nr:unnamed protein product [Digitaria exilis]